MKICSGCGIEKPDEMFRVGKFRCKQCKNEVDKRTRSLHPTSPEKLKYYHHRWYIKRENDPIRRRLARLKQAEYKACHREQINKHARANYDPAKARLYNERTKEKRAERWRRIAGRMAARNREYSRKYNKANPEKVRERVRRYALKYPDIVRTRTAFWSAFYRGSKSGLKFSPTAIYERDRYLCHICRKRVAEKDRSLDHLIPVSHGGPHIPENVALAHRTCNSARGAGRIPAQLRML